MVGFAFSYSGPTTAGIHFKPAQNPGKVQEANRKDCNQEGREMPNSRRKGKTGELDLVNFFKARGLTAYRTQQHSGRAGDDDVRIAELPWVHNECKRTEKCRPYAFLDQAVRDAKEGRIPTVWHRQNGKAWIAINDAGYQIDIYVEVRALRERVAELENRLEAVGVLREIENELSR